MARTICYSSPDLKQQECCEISQFVAFDDRETEHLILGIRFDGCTCTYTAAYKPFSPVWGPNIQVLAGWDWRQKRYFAPGQLLNYRNVSLFSFQFTLHQGMHKRPCIINPPPP